MLKRQSKTETKQDPQGPPRILVVDDNPDAARLIGKLFRRVGYEVAEIGDQSVAMLTLNNEATPVSAVVGSFSSAGNSASLKLLDAIRHAPEPRVNMVRVALMLDHGRQQLFTWQSGVDELVLRPYQSEEMLSTIAAMLKRPDSERSAYRRSKIEQIKAAAAGPEEPDTDAGETPQVLFK